ncbi:uncharacterized protein LOC106658383 [Trichogramma pretiosum]|uniref:uncharacterized protein LOC106658383 n=1 Tax=Trichogramma pretiosum TaxID=7493 RepID=UPI0006C9430C|nr:uncharacterized protein LOC106658383 [Trichogramma pretiosum]
MELSWEWFAKNRIIRWKKSFKCILCTFEFGEDYDEDYFDDITDHVKESPFHIEVSKTIHCDLKDSTGKLASTRLVEEIVENCVFFNTQKNELTCYLCQCALQSFHNLKHHIKGYRHLRNMKLKESRMDPKTYVFTNSLYCKKCKTCCQSPMGTLMHVMKHFPKMLKCPTNIDIIKVLYSHFVCLLCNRNIGYNDLEEHLMSAQHVKRNDFLKSKKQLPQEIQITKAELNRIKDTFFNNFDIDTWYCSKCKKNVSSKSGLVRHFLDENHRKNSAKNQCSSDHLLLESIISYKCYLCNESFGSDMFSLFLHYHNSLQHKIQMENFHKIVKENYLEMKELKNTIVIECSLCKIQVNDMVSVDTHLSGKKHKSCEILNKQLPISQIKSCQTQFNKNTGNKEMDINEVKCEKSKMLELASTKQKSEDHYKKITENNNTEMFNSITITDEEIIELDVLDILNDIDELNLGIKLMDRFIPAHKKESKSSSPNVQIDKVSKFDQNILNNGTQYIDFCIKQGKKYIYNISGNKLAFINLNIDFIIKNNDNQFCLLCNNQISSEVHVIVEHLFSKKHIENLQKKNKSWKKMEGSLNISNDNLTFAIPYILRTTNESFYCHACKNNVVEYNFFEHSLTQDHMLKCEDLRKNSIDTLKKIMLLMKDTWYYAQFFDCQVCNLKFHMEIEFVEHLENQNHCKKVEKCIASGATLEFHTCFACITCIYGDFSKYNAHCDDIFHKRYLSKGDYTVSKMMPPLLDLLNEIEDKKQKLLFESDLIILENPRERSLLKAVEKVVENVYPNATAYKFGSRSSQTALSNSDLDIFLDCDDMYNNNFDAASSHKYLSSVKNCFESHKDVWYIEEVIVDASTPIIKLRHYPTSLKCDISFSNGLSHRKSKLVRYYNDAYPMCRELILYLKKWITFSQLSGTEGISTFTISWLVIFYLQRKGIFPSVHELIKYQTRSIIIDGWECGYQENICIKSNDSTFSEHLVGLFTFYAKFDYQKYVICPYLGKIIEKEKFATRELPAELTAKLSKRKKKALAFFRFDSPMCMQDPTDLSQNSTKALRKRQLRCFREYCSSSVEIIQSGQQDSSV